MSYKLGNKTSQFYAAQDPVTGQYLAAQGWSYGPTDPRKLRLVSWHPNPVRLAKTHTAAQRVLNGLADFYQTAVANHQQILANMMRQNADQHMINLAQAEIDQLHRLQVQPMELFLIQVSTEVNAVPV